MIQVKFIILGIALVWATSCTHVSKKSDTWIPPRAGEVKFGQGVEAASERLIGAPFIDNALGEGSGQHDSDPTSRLDAFDCTTFVETVWVMALARDQGQFWKDDLQKLRYRHGEIAFTERLHFITLDWMPYHQNRGALVDVTADLGLPLAESVTIIDRTAWYKTMHPTELAAFLRRYPTEKSVTVTTRYLTFKQLLEDPQGVIRLHQALQNGALVANFIRPNWDTVKYIGTRIDVSHQGFLLLQGDTIILRHASAVLGKVGDEDFVQYMKAYRNHATLKGIQLARIKSL